MRLAAPSFSRARSPARPGRPRTSHHRHRLPPEVIVQRRGNLRPVVAVFVDRECRCPSYTTVPHGQYPCRPAPDHWGIQGAGLGFTMTQEPPKGVPRDAAGRNQQWGMLDWAATDTRSEPDTGNAALRGYATIPAPCYPAARAAGVEAEIELPFAAPYQAGGECWIGGVPARPLVRCAESGVRRDGRAAPDHLHGSMAGCPGLAVGDGALVRVVGPTSRSRCCSAP